MLLDKLVYFFVATSLIFVQREDIRLRWQFVCKQDGGFDANSTWELEGPMTGTHRSKNVWTGPRALALLESANSSRLWMSVLAGKLQVHVPQPN